MVSWRVLARRMENDGILMMMSWCHRVIRNRWSFRLPDFGLDVVKIQPHLVSLLDIIEPMMANQAVIIAKLEAV